MKKTFILAALALICSLTAMAQTGMSDEQVIEFVVKEHEAGTSQAQIVTKLMQRGVNIQQIKRVKSKYERQIKQNGLGVVADEAVSKAETRMRNNNGQRQNIVVNKTISTNKRVQAVNQWQREYDQTDDDFLAMQNELMGILPTDSIQWLNQLLAEKEAEKKKVFGRDIFNNPELSFEPSMNIATPLNYKLGPGDAVFIDVYGASNKNIQATVSPEGDINIDDFGPVQVSGLTVEQANARLKATLGTRYSNSQIKLTVGQTKTIMVNVMGEVNVPGTYTLSAFSTVFHALYMAGGINDLGTLRSIKVYRDNKMISTVDIYDYILNGQLKGNVKLAEGDVIVVGPYDCLVDVTGKAKRPMFYEMKRDESLASLIKYAGGFTGDAYTKSVRVVRKTGRERSVFNVGEFDMASFHVADGDSVSIDSILPRYENTVELKGAVFRPGLYQLGGSINSVRSLIEQADGLTEEAFTARGVIHRMKTDRTLEVVSVDIKGIMEGRIADVPLKQNDVLFIPTRQDAMTQRTITIHGEVQYPGIYKYAENETLEDLVLQAGGLKESASMIKVDVARRVNDPYANSNDTVTAQTFSFALKDGFVVDGTPGFILKPFDEVYVRKSPGYTIQQNVTIEGQAMFPGTYTLSVKNERLSDILEKAGGLNDLAYSPGARLERRITPDERLRMESLLKMLKSQSGNDSLDVKKLELGNTYYVGIELDKALQEPGGDADIVLREGDRIIIPEYNGTVKISGDVMYPNTVAFKKGKRLSYYIDQAGGWGDRAKKSNTYILYMNGTVAKASHKAKVLPGCEIIVPSKPKKDGRSLAQILTIGTSVASLATMIATLANILK